MSYKFSKGYQIIGDLSGSDDANRDTGIDFEENEIRLVAGGANVLVVSGSKVGIGSDSPSHKLDINGDIRVRGNDIRDNSGNPAVTFDGSANTTIVNNLTVQDYTFPASDGNADQVLQTNGSGQLSFVDVDGGGGGGGGGSSTPQVLKAGINVTFNLSGSAQFQTIPFENVLFDTFTTGGWDAVNYKFLAGETGYYDISATVVFDELDENPTQYQLWLISNSDHGTPNSLVGAYIGLVQLAPTPSDMDMGTLQINTIAHLSSSQSASVSIRQTGTNNSGTTTLLAPKNRTFICIKKL